MNNTWRENAGLLVLRAGVGGVLVAHGVQKLFGWLGGHGLAGTGAAFEQMGFQPGRQAALAAGLGEAGGGVLIALGLATHSAPAQSSRPRARGQTTRSSSAATAAGRARELASRVGTKVVETPRG